MLCPQCQLPLIVSKLQSEEINECPKCHGVWLKSESVEKLIEQIPSPEKPKQTQPNNQNKVEQHAQNKSRKRPHFLSGAFDTNDDW